MSIAAEQQSSGPLYEAYMYPTHDVGSQFDVPEQLPNKKKEGGNTKWTNLKSGWLA